jgi:hypothetical protein
MSWGDMMRDKMKKNIEFSMKMRRIRRAWYNFVDDTPENIAGFVCLLMALVVCAAAWYSLNLFLERLR